MNREKMAKIAHFVLKICTNRFRDYKTKKDKNDKMSLNSAFLEESSHLED